MPFNTSFFVAIDCNGHANRARINVILSLSLLLFRFRPHLARVRGAQRLVTVPRNSVHIYRCIQTAWDTSLEFISRRSRGCTHCSLSWDARSYVTILLGRSTSKFRFPPPLPPPPCMRPSMSMFTGALSIGRDYLTRRRCVVLYRLHPAKVTRGNPRGYKLFFSRAKATCSAIGMKEKEKRFLFPFERYNFARFNSSCNNDWSDWRQKLSKTIS